MKYLTPFCQSCEYCTSDPESKGYNSCSRPSVCGHLYNVVRAITRTVDAKLDAEKEAPQQ